MSKKLSGHAREREALAALREWAGFGPDDADAPRNQGVPAPTQRKFVPCEACGGNGIVPVEVMDVDFNDVPQPTKPAQKGGPTDKQLKFVRELLKEREGNELAEQVRTDLNRWRNNGILTGAVVSNAIGRLLKIPKNRRPMASDTYPKREGRK